MIMVSATTRGLQLKDLDNMTLGQLIDYVIVYNNLHEPDGEKTTQERTANQADFDRF